MRAGEEAGLGCHDIRHQNYFVYRQVASILFGAVCPPRVERRAPPPKHASYRELMVSGHEEG